MCFKNIMGKGGIHMHKRGLSALLSVVILGVLAFIVGFMVYLFANNEEKPTEISKLTEFYNSKTYESFELIECHFSHPVGSQVCITSSFETKSNKNILLESLQLKKELETFLEINKDLYHDLYFECIFSTDSAYSYIRIANFSSDEGVLSNQYYNLTYGDFYGMLGSLSPFKDSTMFEYLCFTDYRNLDDLTFLDNQVNLKSLQFIACNKITEGEISYLQRAHPNCVIQVE